MLSRTASTFFWIARYTERAEYTARLTNVHYHLLLENDDPREHVPIWQWYLDSSGQLSLYEEICGQITTRAVLEFLTVDRRNPNAIVNLIGAARENARGIQDQLSSETWHHINTFYLAWKDYQAESLWASPHQRLLEVQDTCYRLHGIMASTMLHDEGWSFYRLGKDIERAGHTARLLLHPILLHAPRETSALSEFHQSIAILKSASAYEAYRKIYRSVLLPEQIVEFLLLNQYFPRSVRFCARALGQNMERLSEHPLGTISREPARLVGQLAADLDFMTLEEVFEIGLEPLLTEVVERLDRITTAVTHTFFGVVDSGAVQPPGPRRPRRLSHPEPTLHKIKALLSARNQFTYRYESPVTNVRTVMRLAPNQHYGRQRRLDIRWHMEPAADYRHYLDAFGNLVWQMDHLRVEKEITCTVEMRVETEASYGSEGHLVLQGIGPHETDCSVEASEFMRLTSLVDRSDKLSRMAQRLQEKGDTAGDLTEAILHQVHAALRYERDRTHIGTTASEAVTLGAGVCQDFTHVMLAVCRLAELPARYVSGLLPGEGQMHAWVEVLLPIGPDKVLAWVGFDPTHQRRCDERYITVAIGRDYQDIAPTSGYYEGKATSSLEMAVSVTMESHGPAERWSTSQGQAPTPVPSLGEQQQQQ